MKRTLLFIVCVLTSITMLAQEESNDYLPFVDRGKMWAVARSTPGQDAIDEVEYYIPFARGEVNENGKTYYKMKAYINNTTETETYLIREEDRKVYHFDTDIEEEHLMFDYSLKAGDTYQTYSYDEQKEVTYKVLSVSDYREGPEVLHYIEEANGITTQHRYLRKWTVCRTDKESLQKTWIEGIGSLEGPFSNLYDASVTISHLAYVKYSGQDSNYLPFSFRESIGKLWFGCNMPIGSTDHSEDKHHQLTYELDGDRLHVYGKAYGQFGLNGYAYFIEEPTDNPFVRKLHFYIQEIEPTADCMSLHAIDFYVPGFDPNLNYIIVDNQGVEHQVINKTEQNDYRPLVEEGKHWTYDNFMPLRPAEYDHYYYYDLRGDTLIAGKNCLKMFSDNSNNDGIVRYEGALYEENKKVYCFYPEKEEAVLLYDFDCEVGDTIHVDEGEMVVKDIRTEDNGGIPIKKYTFQIISDYEEEYVYWIEGVGAMMDFFSMMPAVGNYCSLNACELNGEKLYQTVEPEYTEEGYHKMAIEGKRWNYIHYYMEEDGFHEVPYSYVVKGDTIIRRTTYKKLWYQDEKTERFVCLLFERGREVLKSVRLDSNDSPLMKSFFDFGREDFGRVFTWKAVENWGNTNWMVYGVDTIEVNNRPFRRYTCLQKYSKEGENLTTIEYDGKGVWHDIWVEGVGSESSGIEDQIPLHELSPIPPGEYDYDFTRFVSCYEDGECIFTADDFNIQPTPKPDINMAYYYYYEGKRIPLTLNENKVVVSIPKDCGEITERFRANVQTLFMINDEAFDIYVIPQSEYEKLTTLDFWAEDAKSIILTSGYFTESNEEVFATPYLNVRLKKEEDIDLLNSYAEQYKLTIVRNSPLMPLWYILAVTLESEKSPLECANELYESGNFASSVPDLAGVIFPQTAYRPFVEEGKVWKVGDYSGNPVQKVEYYYFDGDTIIGGKTCKQMMCQRYVNAEHPDYAIISQLPSLSYVGAWYEEDKKVYVYNTTDKQFKLMYDFSVDDNAPLQIHGQTYVIGLKQSGGMKGFKGVYRDVMWGGGELYNTYNTTWLEGVGNIDGPTYSVYLGEENHATFLMSCTVGDEVIYLNDEYEDGATPESMNAKKRFDFTHTIKVDPKAPKRRGAGQPLYGEYNNCSVVVNLYLLDEAYQVRITDATGKIVYEKNINAGNIVGLNIDISTYPEGCYTVTMENNHESFIGEFEIQTTGIAEVRSKQEAIRGSIYNLHGQRLNSLQKGLNIVNGRKVYVGADLRIHP